MPRPDRRRSIPRINAVVALAADALDRARDADARLARGETPGPLHGVPFTIKDSLDTAGLVTTAGSVGWRDRVPDRDADGRRPAAGGRRDPARQDEHAGVHLVGRDRQRRLRPDDRTPTTSSGHPAAAAAGRPRSSPRAARRSTSAATPATASASRPTSAASPASSRRAAACRGPAHWPSFAGICSGSLTAARPDRPSRRGPGADPADHRRPGRRGPARAARDDRPGRPRRRRRRRASASSPFTDNGLRTPTPETIAAVEAAADAIWRRPGRSSTGRSRRASTTPGTRGTA